VEPIKKPRNEEVTAHPPVIFPTRKKGLKEEGNMISETRHLVLVVQSLLLSERLVVRVLALHPSFFHFSLQDDDNDASLPNKTR
jgi:hypothetical protein